jgi:hypothetical protein
MSLRKGRNERETFFKNAKHVTVFNSFGFLCDPLEINFHKATRFFSAANNLVPFFGSVMIFTGFCGFAWY